MLPSHSRLWDTDPYPKPDLSPEDVVKIQLDALQNNDVMPNDDGIRIAFRFASPTNRDAAGPLPHFITMVKSPLYIPLIGFEVANLEELQYAGRLAQQRVTIRHRGGLQATYIFSLSKQIEGDYKNCWLTDGVLRVG